MCSKKTAITKSYIINIMENGNKIYKIYKILRYIRYQV